eukprot:6194079-Pleurochrysis_carterae.AAC.1
MTPLGIQGRKGACGAACLAQAALSPKSRAETLAALQAAAVSLSFLLSLSLACRCGHEASSTGSSSSGSYCTCAGWLLGASPRKRLDEIWRQQPRHARV